MIEIICTLAAIAIGGIWYVVKSILSDRDRVEFLDE